MCSLYTSRKDEALLKHYGVLPTGEFMEIEPQPGVSTSS